MPGVRSRRTAFLWFVATIAVTVYWLLAANGLSQRIILATGLLGISAAGLALLFSIPLVWSLNQSRNSKGLLIGTFAAASVPVYLQVGAWDSIFGKLGWLTSLLDQAFVPFFSRWVAAIWIHGMAATPQVALIMLAGLRLGNGQYEEQGLLDASRFAVFWRVTFWRLTPFVVLSLVWVLIQSAREIAVADLFQIGTLAEYIYLGYALGQGDQILQPWTDDAQELGLAVQLMTIAWFACSAIWLVTRVLEIEFAVGAQSGRRTKSRLAWGIGWLILGLILLVPMINLCIRGSLAVERSGTEVVQVFRGRVLSQAFWGCLRDYRSEALWTLAIGVCGSVSTLVTCLGLAAYAQSRRFAFALMVLLSGLLLAVPGPLIGSAINEVSQGVSDPFLIWLFDRTVFGPTLASTLFIWPLAMLMVWILVQSSDRTLDQHAELEGAGRWTRFWTLFIKRHPGPLLGLGCILVVLIGGELSAAQTVQVAGVDSLPRLTLGFLHSGVDEKTAALTCLSLLGFGSLAGLGWFLTGLVGSRDAVPSGRNES